MFDKLVVSTNERRTGRTARFFIGTVVTYLAAVTAALALSVVVSSPRMADTGGLSKMPPVIQLAGPAPSPGPRPPKPTTAPAPDPNHPMDLSTLIDHMHTAQIPVTHSTLPPGVGSSVKTDDFGTDPGGLPGFGDGLGEGPGTGVRIGATLPPPVPPPPAPVVDSTPKTVRLPSTVLQGKAIVRRTPPYPPLARLTRQAGSVSVEIVLSPDGRVESARAVSGHPLLAQAAVDAAYEWRFEPTLLNGNPVRVTGMITFVFKFD